MEDCPKQTWLYRYDCIVNMAYPQIALQRNTVTNQVEARHFTGDEAQRLDPELIEGEKYCLVTADGS